MAVPSQATVRLSWTPSPDTDVAGYVVYRGDGPASRSCASARSACRGPPSPTATCSPGSYRYAVTAQDTSVRANESRPTNEVTVTVP